jgi:starch synthase
LQVVFITTEAVPLAKTGGLADVCGALPRALAERGHRVSLIMPAYRQAIQTGLHLQLTNVHFSIPMAGRTVDGRMAQTVLPDSQVQVYLIDQPHYYDRDELYGDHRGDYADNCERFAFFCRAALATIHQLGLNPEIVHCHDWQTGLVPAYLATRFDEQPWMSNAAAVMTVHNLAYQGRFWHWDMLLTGLGWEYFNWQQMEFYGQLNLMKTGLVFADAISTVSPRYAEEIQGNEHGWGLDGVLRSRRQVLTGIINGVDHDVWDPAHDPLIVHPYDDQRWQIGKQANREFLCHELNLPYSPELPLVGLIGRLADQKGWDLVIELLGAWLSDRRPVQWVVLGTGEARFQESLGELGHAYPERLAVHIGFSDRLAHLIEASCDIFLMPSRYEPCGLNQLYSLRYGAVPVVNPVGGLLDTVVDCDEQTLANGTATGFHMRGYHSGGLAGALDRAISLRRDDPESWSQVVRTGMCQDWSWGHSAGLYERLYCETLSRKYPGRRQC